MNDSNFRVSLSKDQLILVTTALACFVDKLADYISILEDPELVAHYKSDIYDAQVLQSVLINSIGRRND